MKKVQHSKWYQFSLPQTSSFIFLLLVYKHFHHPRFEVLRKEIILAMPSAQNLLIIHAFVHGILEIADSQTTSMPILAESSSPVVLASPLLPLQDCKIQAKKVAKLEVCIISFIVRSPSVLVWVSVSQGYIHPTSRCHFTILQLSSHSGTTSFQLLWCRVLSRRGLRIRCLSPAWQTETW